MNENFKREVENWQHEGIINSSQAQAILSKTHMYWALNIHGLGTPIKRAIFFSARTYK